MEEVGTGTVRRRGGYVLGALGVAALVLVGGVLGRADSPPDLTAPPTVVTLPTATIPPATTPPATPSSVAVAVAEVGQLMPVPAGWELLAQGPGLLVRLELASGRITRTVVPGLDSGGPLSFVAGPGRALIRPGDAVDGYAVDDGQPARRLTAPTLRSGLLVPGPAPGLVWAEGGDQRSRVSVLIDLDGRPTGPTIPLPASVPLTSSDGGGYLLVTDVGGVYQATPAGLRRITTGTVLAAGPTGWLVVDCDDRHQCTRAVVDRASWARRSLPGPAPTTYADPGVITPDGSVAAVLIRNDAGAELHLIDLGTGADRALPIPVGAYLQPGALLWAPDSTSLFTLSAGQPVVVDARTGRGRVLVPDLPSMTLLAFRGNS